MRLHKEQFKEFERQDVKYREDLKHLKQKIKKLEDKAGRVAKIPYLIELNTYMYLMFFTLQDSSKVDGLLKECDDSTALIPQLENNIPKLQKILLDEERFLEEIVENSKGGFFSFI